MSNLPKKSIYNDYFDNTTINRAGTAPQLIPSNSLFNTKNKVAGDESTSSKLNSSPYLSQPWETANNRPSTSSVATRGQALPELNRLLKGTKVRPGVIPSNYNELMSDDNESNNLTTKSPYAQPLVSSSSRRHQYSSRGGGSASGHHLYTSDARLDSAKPKSKPKPFSSFTTSTSPYYSESNNSRDSLRPTTSQRNLTDESSGSYSFNNRLKLSTVTAIYGSSSKPKNAKKHKSKAAGRQTTSVATSSPFEIVVPDKSKGNSRVSGIAEEFEKDDDSSEPRVDFGLQHQLQHVPIIKNERSDPRIGASGSFSGAYEREDGSAAAEDESASQFSREDDSAAAGELSALRKLQSQSYHRLIVNEELEESQHWTDVLASASALPTHAQRPPSATTKTFGSDDVDIDDEPEELSMYVPNDAKGFAVRERPPTRKVYLSEGKVSSPNDDSNDSVEGDAETETTELGSREADARPPTRKMYLTSSESVDSRDADEDRPPSRQRTAFPFHLGDQQNLFHRNATGSGSNGARPQQQSSAPTSQSVSILNDAAAYFATHYDKPDPNATHNGSNITDKSNKGSDSNKGRMYVETALLSEGNEFVNYPNQHTYVRGQLSGGDMSADDNIQRPPSRQKINAQYLDGSSNSAAKNGCSTPKFKKTSVNLTKTNSQSSLMRTHSQSKLNVADNSPSSGGSTPKAGSGPKAGRANRQFAPSHRAAGASQTQSQSIMTSTTAPALPGASLTMGSSSDYQQHRGATSIGTNASSGLYGFTSIRGGASDAERGYAEEDEDEEYNLENYGESATGSSSGKRGKSAFKIIINNYEDEPEIYRKATVESARNSSDTNKYTGISDAPSGSRLSSKYLQKPDHSHAPLHSSHNNLWIGSTNEERRDSNNFPSIGKINSTLPLSASAKASLLTASDTSNRAKNVSRHNSTFSAETHASAIISDENDISSSYDEDHDMAAELQDGSNLLETSLDATFLGLFSM